MILFYFNAVYQGEPVELEFQFHYDLILLLYTCTVKLTIPRFQFHYDLILLQNNTQQLIISILFQFHYDLILFVFFSSCTFFCKLISISL